MSEWLLTVAGIAIISFLIKIIMPDGVTRNLVSFILSAICVLAIVNPLSSYLNKGNDYFYDLTFELDEDYLRFATECKKDYYLTISKSTLKKRGIDLNYAEFLFSDENDIQTLKKIYIKTSDLVIIENDEHINITYITKNTLAELFSINLEQIEIYD